MQNELHDRLEYLVNYSSQLIFVSGDSIANQQRTLETFVYQQNDDTEIAYLTADASMDIADYRRQLCRQLLGQVVGSFVRPLNELLSDLNAHEGPVLIAITQAQHIPDNLLQELWDLVLQSRFAGNKQHLNVLLFADTAWAERAKQWLPSKNTDTPLLISSQSVHTESGGSDLDKLIARRREEFQAHLANRASASATVPSSMLSRRWFIPSVMVLFIVIFGSLIAWQYGNDIHRLFTPIDGENTPQPDSALPGEAFSELFEETESSAPDSTVESTPANTTPLPDKSPSETSLVASWPDAVGALDDKRNTGLTTRSEVAEDDAANAEPTDGAVTLATTAQEQSSLPATAQDTMATEDSQDNGTDNIDQASQVSQPGTAQPEAATDASSEQKALITAPDTLLEQVRDGDFYIQMAGLSDKTLLSQFIADNQLAELTHVYRTFRYGGDWFVVLFHQPFSTSQQARAAMQQLPGYQGRNDAFVKSGVQIRSEVMNTEAPPP